MMVEEYEYQLKKEIMIAENGSMVPVGSVLLVAPSAKNSRAATGLQRLVQQSLSAKASDKEPTEEEKKKAQAQSDADKDKPIRERFPARDVINVIAASDLSGNTLEDAKNLLFSLLTNGCAKMNDRDARQGDLDKLSLYDVQNILGEYVANFLSNFLFE